MTITIEVLTAVATFLVTMLLGYITGKTTIPNKYIPLQNLLIGILVGIGAWYYKLYPDIVTALIASVFATLGAGGTYDLLKTKEGK